MLKGRLEVPEASYRVRKAISGVAIRMLIGVESTDLSAKRTLRGDLSMETSAEREVPGGLSKVKGGL